MTWSTNPYTNENAKIEELIVENIGLVKHIISRMEINLPYGLDKDDLLSIGNMGLIEAARNFDAGRNVKFQTFAYIRIRGSILDEIRKLSFGGQAVMRRQKQLSDVYRELEQELGRTPLDKEVADRLGVDIEKLEEMLLESSGAYLLSIDDDHNDPESIKIIDKIIDRDDQLEAYIQKERLELVEEAIKQLPENEAMVLSLYYERQLSLKEISLIMDVSESRVCQIHKKAILSVQSKLNRM